MKRQLITLIAALAITGVAQAAGNVDAGKAKTAACMACHGADGNSPEPKPGMVYPKLAGQHASVLHKQLKDFKNPKSGRMDPIMMGMVAALSDADMADISAFYASQKKTLGTAAADKVKAGEKIYRAGNPASGVTACTACHGPAGAGNGAAGFPQLNGQHAMYTEKALKDFRSGKRANDLNKMMRDIAGKLTDAEIAAVAQYIQGLR